MKYICIEPVVSIVRVIEINIGDSILILDDNYYNNTILIGHDNSGYKLSIAKSDIKKFTTLAELREQQIDSILED